MSAIAYVADEEMLANSRMFQNRTILFWRLSNKKELTYFHHGDLLFFFARPIVGTRKCFIGYAHYDKTVTLSIPMMWKHYGEETGYTSLDNLKSAIDKAANGNIPNQISCFLLKQAVFFNEPIIPESVNIHIPNKLESFQYLDRKDPSAINRILRKAKEGGEDIWSSGGNLENDQVFVRDEILYTIASIFHQLGKIPMDYREDLAIRKDMDSHIDEGWLRIPNYNRACVKIDDKIYILWSMQANLKNHSERFQQLIGRMFMMKCILKKYAITLPIEQMVSGAPLEELEIELVNKVNEDRL